MSCPLCGGVTSHSQVQDVRSSNSVISQVIHPGHSSRTNEKRGPRFPVTLTHSVYRVGVVIRVLVMKKLEYQRQTALIC